MEKKIIGKLKENPPQSCCLFFFFYSCSFFLFIFKSLRSFSFLQRKKQLDLKVCFFFTSMKFYTKWFLCFVPRLPLFRFSLCFFVPFYFTFFLSCSLEYVGDNEFNKNKRRKICWKKNE